MGTGARLNRILESTQIHYSTRRVSRLRRESDEKD